MLLRVPVYPWLRKYLLYHYPEPMSVSDRGYATALFKSMLEKPVKVDPAKLIRSEKLHLGEHFGVLVGCFSAAKYGTHISIENIKDFNASMDDLMREEMFRFVTIRIRDGAQADQSIKDFMDIYEITEDDLPFDNLKRWYYRERERLTRRREIVYHAQGELILTF